MAFESRRGSGRAEEKEPGFGEAHKLHACVTAGNSPSQGSENDKEAIVHKLPGGSKSQGTPETVVRHMKCFKCHQKGHVTKNCPQNANSARVIAVDQETTTDEEC